MIFLILKVQILPKKNIPKIKKTIKILPEEFQPIQSEYDNRKYKSAVLSNGLKVLAIQEDGLDKSCASINVHIGYFCDPEDLPGTAHFLEHLLFQGTEKYKEDKEYIPYIFGNGGQCNAQTSEEFTSFYFDIASTHFEGALDRLAQFFIAPLFTESSTISEMNAIDSEHKGHIEHDEWRIHMLSRIKASKNHPLHKFGTGDINTLNKTNVRERIIDFYNTYYSSHLMSLVVYGSENVDDLLGMAIEKFSAVKFNPNVVVPKYSFLPFDKDNVGTIMHVKPVKDLKRIMFTWQLPSLLESYTKKSEEYLIQLLGDEGNGSILQCLKTKNLATALNSRCEKNSDFSLLILSIELTDEGEKNYWQISEVVFTYISILQSSPVQHWVMEERAQLSRNNFIFKEKTSPVEYALSLSKNLHLFPSKHVLNGNYLLENIDMNAIKGLLDELVAEKVRITFVSRQFDLGVKTEIEPHYNASYQYQKIPSEAMQRLTNSSGSLFPDLGFPEKNPFISSNFKLAGQIVSYDKRIVKPIELVKDVFWFKQDDTFGLPLANVNFMLQHPTLFKNNVKDYVLNVIFCECFISQTAHKFYPAMMANLDFKIIPSFEGIEFKFNGFNDKLYQLIHSVLTDFFTFIPDEETFKSIKELKQREYKNYDSEAPHLLVYYWMNHHLIKPSFSYLEKSEECNSIQFQDIYNFSKKIRNESFGIKALLNGNYNEDGSKRNIRKCI